MHSTDLDFPRKLGPYRYFLDEIEAFHPGVDVYWHPNAWADTKVSLEWIQNTLRARTFSENRTGFVLFCDNLSSQVSEEFLEAAKNINNIVRFGVSDATDIWQPVDCGTVKILKQLVSRIQDKWLQHDDNIDLWLTATRCQTPSYFNNTLGW